MLRTKPNVNRMSRRSFLITCEHAGNYVPNNYRYLFLGSETVLESHRGYDIGAGEVAQFLADSLKLPLYVHMVSRLLVDVNRSKFNPELYSDYSRGLDSVVKKFLIKRYYTAYRQPVYEWIKEHARKTDSVAHFSIHSFTPMLSGEVRTADIGLLYDEKRRQEVDLAQALEAQLKAYLPQMIIKHNYPYKGTADGFTTHLRKEFKGENYMGLEIEVNQKYHHRTEMQAIKEGLRLAIKSVMEPVKVA